MPLIVVATPIGNLEDASPRMIRVLRESDLILCEDTRRTRALLTALEIPARPLKSCHAHNETTRVDDIVRRLRDGEHVALVSDAGTPGISDPGGIIVAAAHAAGLDVRCVAGPSSVAAALSVAGFAATPFHFLGFPPRKAGPLRALITQASQLQGPFVFLESGRRVGRLIGTLAELCADRELVMCREMSKKYEEILRRPAREMPTTEQKGEVVLVVGPGAPVAAASDRHASELKEIAARLADRWGCSKRDAYNALMELEKSRP